MNPNNNPHFRRELTRIIGVDPEELIARLSSGDATDGDFAAHDHLTRLLNEVENVKPIAVRVVLLCQLLTEDALRCCVSTDPETPSEDAAQRVFRHLLDIKRIHKQLDGQ